MMHFQTCIYAEKVKGAHRHLLGAYTLVQFWNVGGMCSCEPSVFSRKQRSSDLRSPALANFTGFKFSKNAQ